MESKHWCNGRWTRLTRRDVFARPAADGQWSVELRRGGPGGRSRTRSFGSEQDAVAWVEDVLVDVDAGWRLVAPRSDAVRLPNGAHQVGIAS